MLGFNNNIGNFIFLSFQRIGNEQLQSRSKGLRHFSKIGHFYSHPFKKPIFKTPTPHKQCCYFSFDISSFSAISKHQHCTVGGRGRPIKNAKTRQSKNRQFLAQTCTMSQRVLTEVVFVEYSQFHSTGACWCTATPPKTSRTRSSSILKSNFRRNKHIYV